MERMKKFLAMAMVVMLMLSCLPVSALAAETDTTVYLLPNGNWTQSNAWFAAYYFEGEANGWVKLSGPDANGYYKGTIPAGYSGLIFTRMNPGSSALSWDSKWDQTQDLTTPITNNVYFAVKEGDWNSATGTWTASPKVSTFTVAGSSDLCGVNWDVSATANDMEVVDGLWTKTYTNVPAGSYEFKVAMNHSWDASWPASNYALTLTQKADVRITFNRSTGEVKATVLIPVTDVTLDQTSVALYKSQTATLTATVTPSNATDKAVTWTSSDPSVATVSDGVVTAVGGGTATITATAGGKSASCMVTVQDPVASVTIGGVTTKYGSLQKALDAVKSCKASDNAVVKLLSNTTVTAMQTVTGGVFTLDLGTYTVSSTNSNVLGIQGGTVEITGTTGKLSGNMGMSVTNKNASVTVSGGTIESTGTMPGISMSSGKLTIAGGTIRGGKGITANNSSLTITGGTIEGDEVGVYLYNCQVSITGGSIIATTAALSHNDSQYSDGKIEISGGSFAGSTEMFDGCWGSIGRLPVLTGGSFPGGLVTNSRSGAFPVNDLLAEGYAYWQNGKMLTLADDVTSIEGAVEVKPACKHNNGGYTGEGDTISFECADCGTTAEAKLVAPENLTYNGEEKTVTVESSFEGVNLPEVTYEGDRKNVGTFTAKLTFADGIEAELNVTITPAKLTIESIEVADKVYDGTKDAVVTNVVVSGIIGSDDVKVDGTGSFADKNVGENKTVEVVCLVSGTNGGNYTVEDGTATASITPAVITVTAFSAANKVYDGNTNAAIVGIDITGAVTGDDVAVRGAGQFADKEVGQNKTVSATFTLSGADAGNYELAKTTGTTTASITAPKDPSSPSTGDGSNLMLWTMMMLLSVTAAAALVTGKKRYI